MSVVNITSQNFQSAVMEESLPVLIDFWAAWCGPCRMVSPIVDQLAEELDGKIVVGKVNVDEEPELAAKFGIMSIPTLAVMKSGQVVKKSIGAKPKEAIRAMLDL
ncbi:MAG: thioredoxin [Bacillota bacterium]|nr:thioredoxin [Bacillota bacterium]